MAATKTPGLHFVVSTDVEKHNPELRKFIRSHVMVGKNRGRTLPLRKRKRKEVRDDSHSDSHAHASGTSPIPNEPSASSTTTVHPILSATVPHKFGSNLATINFADTIDPQTIEVILQFCSIAKKLLFSLEACILFERRAEDWIAPLAIDPAYLHCVIFTSQHLFDAILPRKSSPFSQRTLPHFLKTVELLRERLEHGSDQIRLSNTTVRAVMGLAGHALLIGDVRSAKHHIEGLKRIIGLRGGVASFGSNTKLIVEILRCDLGIALYSGSSPVFFSNPSSQESFTPYPNLKLLLNSPRLAVTPHNDAAIFLNDIDISLSQSWKVLSEFCCVINFAIDSKQYISTETFLDAMASVMYRLLDLHFQSDSCNEAVRLGMLAFSCSVFLQWKQLGMSYTHLKSAFRISLKSLASLRISKQLQLWLLMVGAVSVFDETDDEWLKPLLLVQVELCEMDSWTQMREMLKSFLWIGLVHDKPGQRLFDTVIGRGSQFKG